MTFRTLLQPARDPKRARGNAAERSPGWESSAAPPRSTSTAVPRSPRERLYATTLVLVALAAAVPLLVSHSVLSAVTVLSTVLSLAALYEQRQWIGAWESLRLITLFSWAQATGQHWLAAASAGQAALVLGYAMSGGDSLFRAATAIVDAQQVDSLDGWAQ